MCGIVGFFKNDGMIHSIAEDTISSMTNSLLHRGPDDSAIFSDLSIDLLLGHRRLSILDTTKGGLQPMQSKSGNLVIVFNGEIYNHNDLRYKLENENKSII